MYEVCSEYEITVRYIRFRLPPKFPEDIIYSVATALSKETVLLTNGE